MADEAEKQEQGQQEQPEQEQEQEQEQQPEPQAQEQEQAAAAAETTEPEKPSTMQVLMLHEYDGGASLRLETVPMPVPSSGEVLVKVAYSPVNPSDLAFLHGQYGVQKELPCVPGFEGSGTVVASGGGILAWRLKDSNVAFYNDNKKQTGTWAEYTVVRADRCIKLDPTYDLKLCSMSVVNPVTAQCFMEIISSKRSKGAVHTAAASALGKILVRMCETANVELINVVRRAEQVEMLTKLGVKPENVINTSEDNWEERLAERAAAVGALCGFDAVGGQLAGQVFRALPPQSTLYVYGSLDKTGVCDGFPVKDMIFHGKKLEGFWSSQYLKNRNILSLIALTSRVASLVGRAQFPMEIQRHASLADGYDAIKQYVQNMSQGKVLFVPDATKMPAAEGEDAAAATPAE